MQAMKVEKDNACDRVDVCYTEQCKDVPECWVEQQEECHTVQVKVHHQEQPKYQKWKRSSEEEGIEDVYEKVEVDEDDIGTVEGTKIEGEEMAADVGVRKERSLLAGFTGAVVGGHIAKKLGFSAGLAIGLGSKKLALKKKAAPKAVHHKSHHKAVHHKSKQETVCNNVPVKRCTSTKQCEKVPWQKCEKLPVKNCKQVPNTKCWTTPHEVCTTVLDTQCKQVPHETCHQVPKQRCVSVPNQVCVSIPEKKCWKEPVQKCHQVPEEKCWQEPHQKCWDEPREHCHDKTVRVEKKICVHETKKTEVPSKKW